MMGNARAAKKGEAEKKRGGNWGARIFFAVAGT